MRTTLRLLLATLLLYNFAVAQNITIPKPISGLQRYDSSKAYNGYTILSPILIRTNAKTAPNIPIIDMNGNTVKVYKHVKYFAKLLPGGYAIGPSDDNTNILEAKVILESDWNNNILWKFDHWNEKNNGTWSADQHHDMERSDFPTGYYSPYVKPDPIHAHTFVIAHKYIDFPLITKDKIQDEVIYELDEKGSLVSPENGGFYWSTTDHFDEFGFSDAAISAMKSAASISKLIDGGKFDLYHMNSLSLLGENKWYDRGDERFNPENFIVSYRNTNVVAIIDRMTGHIVWKIGPDYSRGKESRKLGLIVGQHHAHIIQKGLPGAGNILLFDNGGAAGYGHLLNQEYLPTMSYSNIELYSRVLEFDPTTLTPLWEYTQPNGLTIPLSGDNHRFWSVYIGSAQRLPNGNTLVDEGATGRIFEVTKNKEIVWEYIYPKAGLTANAVYRAYRIPSSWLKDNNGKMLKDDNGRPLKDYK